ncbi:DUF6233 domain-containing protein [Streptomyces sp. NPDC050392]|uniref:DUF6233 domain-containing protein n=1 Tax=Streptomyces sp. NPDC050392 TaxID=3155782 RepID=UPI0034358F6D
MSSTIPSSADAPLVDVAMPDRQVLRGRLYERRQTPDGWLFMIGLVLWRLVDDDLAGPGEYRSWMPASSTAPVTGADYSMVPTTRLSQDIPPPPISTVQPVPATRWLVVHERHAYDSCVRRTVVHRADCWQATRESGGTELGTEAEARAAMAEPNARGCIGCGTDQSLA